MGDGEYFILLYLYDVEDMVDEYYRPIMLFVAPNPKPVPPSPG